MPTQVEVRVPDMRVSRLLQVVAAVAALASDVSWRVRWGVANRLSELSEAVGKDATSARLLQTFENLIVVSARVAVTTYSVNTSKIRTSTRTFDLLHNIIDEYRSLLSTDAKLSSAYKIFTLCVTTDILPHTGSIPLALLYRTLSVLVYSLCAGWGGGGPVRCCLSRDRRGPTAGPTDGASHGECVGVCVAICGMRRQLVWAD